MVSKIIKVLADDDDVVSSLSPRVGSSRKETFSNQLEMIRNQLGLTENQVVSHSYYAIVLLSLHVITEQVEKIQAQIKTDLFASKV